MSRRVLVLDGLWYSLCPSFSPLALTRANPLLKQRKPSSRPCPPSALRIAAPPRHRCYSNNASKTDARGHIEDNPTRGGDGASPLFSESTSFPDEHWDNEYDSFDAEIHDEEALISRRKKMINRWPGVPKYAADKSNDSLETLLQTEMAKKPNITSATHILRTLIRDRGVKPSARHYKALIMANSDALHGSPMFVELSFEVEIFNRLFSLFRHLLFIQTSFSAKKSSRNYEIDGLPSARPDGISLLRVFFANTNSRWRLSKLR
jgi:hypothetical protein